MKGIRSWRDLCKESYELPNFCPQTFFQPSHYARGALVNGFKEHDATDGKGSGNLFARKWVTFEKASMVRGRRSRR